MTPADDLPRDANGVVDLGALVAQKEARKHAHRWSVTARFSTTDEVVGTLFDQRAAAVVEASKGDAPTPRTPPQLGLGDKTLLRIEGPGCLKCNVHWADPKAGYGVGCPVSDEDFDRAFNESLTSEDQFLHDIFAFLVREHMPARPPVPMTADEGPRGG